MLLAVDEGRVAPRQREQDVDHAARRGSGVWFFIYAAGVGVPDMVASEATRGLFWVCKGDTERLCV